MLSKMRVLTEADLKALELYCVTYSRWRAATEKLSNDALTYKTPNDYEQQSIWLTIENRMFDNMRKILAEFGMTPASRSRIAAVGEDNKKSGFSEL